ncbi:MAG: hypothetical protein GY925_26180 [Actinomycetia bacterium]|nr:hypothetical protein [Actinomycetes bacterium]
MTDTLFTVEGETFEVAGPIETDGLLRSEHYLGPMSAGWLRFGQYIDGSLVAVQVWKPPTSRMLPADGTWLELARWCLTCNAGENAGSRGHAAFVRWLRLNRTEVTTLVSYSDPSKGHTGALYKACNWVWSPTWHRLREPPTGGGNWGTGTRQAAKDRWIFALRSDDRRREHLTIDDDPCKRIYETLVPVGRRPDWLT